jgi:hypothetical protein
MKNKKYMPILLSTALFGFAQNHGDHSRKRSISHTKEKEVVPKGCKKFYFNEDGSFVTEPEEDKEYVFSCTSFSEKKAKLKFQLKYLDKK